MSAAERLRDLPDEALDRMVQIPLREYLTLLAGGSPGGREVDTTAAAEMLRMDARELRRLAARWYRQQQEGRTPPVRVSRTSAADCAHWRYDEGDLRAYAGLDAEPEVERDVDPKVTAIAARMIANGTR